MKNEELLQYGVNVLRALGDAFEAKGDNFKINLEVDLGTYHSLMAVVTGYAGMHSMGLTDIMRAQLNESVDQFDAKTWGMLQHLVGVVLESTHKAYPELLDKSSVH